ncbi:hypothetical protein MPER_14904, partial [Moniliophthora perniciosa FA553]
MQHTKKPVAGFALEDLVSATTGIAALRLPGRCVGNIGSLSSNGGWPGLCLQDSPLGVRLADFVTSFSTGLNTAAT